MEKMKTLEAKRITYDKALQTQAQIRAEIAEARENHRLLLNEQTKLFSQRNTAGFSVRYNEVKMQADAIYIRQTATADARREEALQNVLDAEAALQDEIEAFFGELLLKIQKDEAREEAFELGIEASELANVVESDERSSFAKFMQAVEQIAA
jgi:hypothetical protein